MSNTVFVSVFKSIRINHYFAIYRYVRNATGRGIGPKLIKGEIKTTKNLEQNRIKNYQEYVKSMKYSSAVENELEIENAMSVGDDYGYVLQNADHFYDRYVHDEKAHKRLVKKNIIKKKYFKHHLETNLLTSAAKQQIRYLHQLDPIKWSPEVLSETFPVSVTGVKKLLRSNFIHKSSETIKEHDQKVAERWKALKSGKPSPLISLITQKLWREGKLTDDNYIGNAHLPNVPTKNPKTIIQNETEEVGEFSALVKTYVDYKKKKLLAENNNSCTETRVTKNINDKKLYKNKIYIPNLGYCTPDEIDEKLILDKMPKKIGTEDDVDLPLHQFKENLIETVQSKTPRSQEEDEYNEWIKKQAVTKKNESQKQPYDSADFFSTTSKYEKNSFELKKDSTSEKYFYVHENNFNHQHPYKKNFKAKIHIPEKLYKKGATYKVGNCVYDDSGDLLYKLPQ